MRRIIFILSGIVFISVGTLNAQVTVALADFKNQSEVFYLDEWEKSIPEFLKSELSSSEKIIIVERRQIEDVLKEQALSMTGLVDSSTAQKVGNMLGAQFVLTGTINKAGGWTRIDAKIIKVSTGHVRSEMVRSNDEDHLAEMVELLANNIRYTLAGDTEHRDKIELGSKYPTNYFLIATAGLAVTTYIFYKTYQNKYDEYKGAVLVKDINERYDSANNFKNTTIIMASITGVALIGTFYCWINNLSPDEVLALNHNNKPSIIPNFAVDYNGKVRAGVSIHF